MKKYKKTHRLRNFLFGLLIIIAVVLFLWYLLVGMFYRQMNYKEVPYVAT